MTTAALPPPRRRELAPWVALGGAVGTTARLTVDALVGGVAPGWDVTTAIVNLTGAFLLGVVALWPFAARHAHRLRAFAGTGVLGAYTTFSALFVAVGTAPLAIALAELAVSIGGGVAAAAGGVALARRAIGPTSPPRDPDHDEEQL